MAKTVQVTPAQIKGAQFLVEQASLGGPAVTEVVRKIANAKTKPKQVQKP